MSSDTRTSLTDATPVNGVAHEDSEMHAEHVARRYPRATLWTLLALLQIAVLQHGAAADKAADIWLRY
jgi:hypothetical protein